MDTVTPPGKNERKENMAIASILEVTSDFMYVEDVDSLLQKIVKAVSETFGLAAASIGIREKDTGLFAIRAAHGFAPEREAEIRKVKYSKERMEKDLKPEFLVMKNTYYVPAEAWEPDVYEDMLFVIHPERMERARRFADEWHEGDYIDFLMYDKNGELLGYLEIDEPDDHKVPGDDTLRAIQIFSDLAAIAIQNAELYDKTQTDQKKIQLLIDLIGHDVNNYAQAVSGFIQLAMARKGIPEPSRKSMGKALDQVWNLNRLVTSVKLYAMAEAEEDKELVTMDLVQVVREGATAAEFYNPSKTVKIQVEDDGTPKYCKISNLAKEIFVNLYSNAIKFDPHEEVVIKTTIEGLSEEGREFWVVTVADNGPGVEDSMKEKIFDRFTQAASVGGGGSGLGLHIAKTLTTIYKGSIWVEDRMMGVPSEGSAFKVSIPKAEKTA